MRIYDSSSALAARLHLWEFGGAKLDLVRLPDFAGNFKPELSRLIEALSATRDFRTGVSSFRVFSRNDGN